MKIDTKKLKQVEFMILTLGDLGRAARVKEVEALFENAGRICSKNNWNSACGRSGTSAADPDQYWYRTAPGTYALTERGKARYACIVEGRTWEKKVKRVAPQIPLMPLPKVGDLVTIDPNAHRFSYLPASMMHIDIQRTRRASSQRYTSWYGGHVRRGRGPEGGHAQARRDDRHRATLQRPAWVGQRVVASLPRDSAIRPGADVGGKVID